VEKLLPAGLVEFNIIKTNKKNLDPQNSQVKVESSSLFTPTKKNAEKSQHFFIFAKIIFIIRIFTNQIIDYHNGKT